MVHHWCETTGVYVTIVLMTTFALVITVFISLMYRGHREGFSDQDQLVSYPRFLKGLSTPESRAYFDNMGVGDLKARNVTNAYDCRQAYLESFVPHIDLREAARTKLTMLTTQADTICSKSKEEVLLSLASLPWLFAILDNQIEGGMPHTHERFICLPLKFFDNLPDMDPTQQMNAIRTLIHEKIHVLQRNNPQVVKHWLSRHGFKPWILRKNIPSSIKERARSNPDLDEYIYRRNNMCATVFILPSDPDSLAHTSAICVPSERIISNTPEEYEHPFEMMAYTLSIQATPFTTVTVEGPA